MTPQHFMSARRRAGGVALALVLATLVARTSVAKDSTFLLTSTDARRVPMNDRAKRAHLDQAVRRLNAEASGAMMGITLLSVGAAELGDRRLLDSLLPFSYRGHMHGPFLTLSETPTNAAVNFLTGAGGFLQQVIFGYTGLRFGANGLEEVLPPVLPSHVRRLLLRNVRMRWGSYEVVVDGTGRHLRPRETVAPR